MKVIEIRDGFGFESLKVTDRPDPAPGPGQVVLEMKAFSVNYRDLLVVNGVDGSLLSRAFRCLTVWGSLQRRAAAFRGSR